MKWIFSFLIILTAWGLASWLAGPALFPGPLVTAREMLNLLQQRSAWENILITFFRGTSGLILAFALGLLAAVPCGTCPALMHSLSPLVAALQACPTIVWISIMMVWAGSGSVVPVTAVTVAVFPVMFFNLAQGIASLDKRLFAMASVYKVPFRRVLGSIILPGVASHLLAALAYALSVSWKVTSTAEFISSGTGVGAQIFWSFRLLNMPALFCWAAILIGFGVVTDAILVKSLRQRLKSQKEARHD